MRKLLAAAAMALGAQAQAATSFSTDVTDLWWNPDESGWGVNVIQQADTVFATFFVYGADGKAHWFVASSLTAQGAASASGVTFQGDLFETNGPYFGVPFNPVAVARRRVGTASLQFALPSRGIVTYTVDGTSVTKSIERQTWAANNVSGSYEGSRGILSASSGCNVGFSEFSGMQIAQSQSAFSMTGNLAGATCSFAGNYSQDGHLGASSGTYSCSNGLAGTYALSEIEASLYGFFARYSGTERGCTVAGRIGGVRTTIRQVAQ